MSGVTLTRTSSVRTQGGTANSTAAQSSASTTEYGGSTHRAQSPWPPLSNRFQPPYGGALARVMRATRPSPVAATRGGGSRATPRASSPSSVGGKPKAATRRRLPSTLTSGGRSGSPGGTATATNTDPSVCAHAHSVSAAAALAASSPPVQASRNARTAARDGPSRAPGTAASAAAASASRLASSWRCARASSM